ncbi:hypothetical protein GCM10017322_27800 [Paracoccus aerius]|nr:hypothetical protein GCM10017322_27800 [Paracoccus aerius]
MGGRDRQAVGQEIVEFEAHRDPEEMAEAGKPQQIIIDTVAQATIIRCISNES